MKGLMCLIGVLLISTGGFGMISIIEIQEAQGYQASYDHTTQTITWSGGASATLYKDDGSTLPISSVNVDFSFTQLQDYSDGVWAHGDFSVINWKVELLHQGNNDYAGYIEGTQLAANVFDEIEGADNPSPFGAPRIKQNELFGLGIVEVTGYDFTYWGNAQWADASGGSAGLLSHTILGDPAPAADLFGSYLTDDYATSETTMWLYADETLIPEPMTMAILGLGSLLALRRRKV